MMFAVIFSQEAFAHLGAKQEAEIVDLHMRKAPTRGKIVWQNLIGFENTAECCLGTGVNSKYLHR